MPKRPSSSPLVKSEMPSAHLSPTPAGGAIMDRNKPPFSHPHDTGKGGIPLKFFEPHSETPASVDHGTTPTRSAGLSSPKAQGEQRPRERVHPPSNRK